MKKSNFLVVFTLDHQRYALPLHAAQRVVRMVAITPLPNAPDSILGVVDFHGQVIPIINVRWRFGLPERAIALTDHLLIAHTARRSVALVVDIVLDVVANAEQKLIDTENILPRIAYVEGVVKLPDGLIFIHDLDTFLSLEEESVLDQALDAS
ncbi:MAG: chemotaxis protein CheW [Herbaspirillum sp.]|jgi:purine-binding chemotaxis protein CheW|nr:chemotaxis protein CheW [Herbaspirillum sp.]